MHYLTITLHALVLFNLQYVTVSFQIGPVGVAGAARTATAAGAQALLLNF